MRTLTVFLTLLLIVSIPVMGELKVGLELYPERMGDLWNDGWLHNGNEWFATDVSFELPITDNLTTNWKIKTFMFATNGVSFVPSSVKFTNSVSYQLFNGLTLKWRHYCHHYFKQFPENPYSDQDKIILEYQF